MQQHSKPHVVALCGSLRDESKTRIALGEALAAAREAGATTELVDLRAYDLPDLYAEDGPVPAAEELRETVAAADSVLLGTPNYHGSFSGVLKNALDYCRRDDFEETTVGLLEVAGGEFPGSALAHLRTVSRTLNAWTLPTEVAIPRSSSTVSADGIDDDAVAERTRTLGRELVRYAGVTASPKIAEREADRSPEVGADD
jgi:NAD(P)H-dependent FMN reductase